jgi:hypothetical protein
MKALRSRRVQRSKPEETGAGELRIYSLMGQSLRFRQDEEIAEKHASTAIGAQARGHGRG